MNEDRDKLAQLLARAAADLDARGWPYGPVVRAGARALLEVPATNPGPSCNACGKALIQPATGRHRRWCSERCRSRARRR